MAKKDPSAPKGKPGRPVGGTALSNVGIKTLRAQEVIEMRARGIPMPVIAKQFNTSDKSLYRLIKWAETEGLMGELKSQALRRLGKLTIDAYEMALKAPLTTTPQEVEVHKMKLTAAKDAGHGIGLLQKKTETHATQETHSMEWFISQRAEKNEQTADAESTPGHESVSPGSFIDAEEIEALYLPADGETGLQEQGDAGGDSFSGEGALGDSFERTGDDDQ